MGVKDTANLALIPAAYKASKVYSALPTDGDGDFTFTRTGSGTRINKAGLIETMATNVPRLNYRIDADGNVSSCPELLLEPERTNFQIYSQEFENSAWTKTRITATDNNFTAPTGTLEATKLAENTSGSNAYFVDDLFSRSGGTYTFSCFLKKGTLKYAGIRALTNNFGNRHFVLLDLESGAVVSTNTLGSGVNWEYNVQNYSNGWYRLSITGNHSSSNVGLLISGSNVSNPTYGGAIPNYNADGNGFFYAYGAQLEAGNFVTSYIHTPSNSAVTRNKDECFISFPGVVSDYPFTLMSTMEILKTGHRGYAFSFLNEYSTSRFYTAGYNVDGGGNFFRFDNAKYGTNYNQKTTATYEAGIYKVAVKFVSDTNFIGYINGLEVVNRVHPSSTFDTGVNDILVGQLRRLSDTTDRNPIKEFYLWNKALTDAEMVEVTSYTSFTEMATQQQFTIQ